MKSTISVYSQLMERWKNRVAVVTGASAGIGLTIVQDLLKSGLIVIGLARRDDRMQQTRAELPKHFQTHFLPIKCDVTIEKEVKETFQWIDENLGGTDILINNAGIMRPGYQLISGDNTKPTVDIIETNIMGILYCTREASISMRERNYDGHIIILNSVLGHKVAHFIGREGESSTNLYAVSKHAVTAMVDTYRQEFINAGMKARITSISPGIVDTDLVANHTMNLETPLLQPEDISSVILYVLTRPSHVQVHDVVIKPLGDRL